MAIQEPIASVLILDKTPTPPVEKQKNKNYLKKSI